VEVKLGIWWTGAHLASETSSHKRYLLQGKGAYASTEGHDLFGQTFYALAAKRAGIAEAKEVFIHLRRRGMVGRSCLRLDLTYRHAARPVPRQAADL